MCGCVCIFEKVIGTIQTILAFSEVMHAKLKLYISLVIQRDGKNFESMSIVQTCDSRGAPRGGTSEASASCALEN